FAMNKTGRSERVLSKQGCTATLQQISNGHSRSQLWKLSGIGAKPVNVRMKFHAQVNLTKSVSAFNVISATNIPAPSELQNLFIQTPVTKPGKFHYILPDDAVKVTIELICMTRRDQETFVLSDSPHLRGDAEMSWDLKVPKIAKTIPNGTYNVVIRFWRRSDLRDRPGPIATSFCMMVTVP
ncbi:MAG: hypothetical protein JWN14_1035, partial [Chthonomonadales bacterium]|nr:hypothetical protein [Chthonomonadales bacterium]